MKFPDNPSTKQGKKYATKITKIISERYRTEVNITSNKYVQ